MIVEKLSDIKGSCKENRCKFNAMESTGKRRLDCISVFKHKSDPNNYYGLYHEMDSSISNFNLYLAKSPDGIHDWQDLRMLDHFASQGKAWVDPKS